MHSHRVFNTALMQLKFPSFEASQKRIFVKGPKASFQKALKLHFVSRPFFVAYVDY